MPFSNPLKLFQIITQFLRLLFPPRWIFYGKSVEFLFGLLLSENGSSNPLSLYDASFDIRFVINASRICYAATTPRDYVWISFWIHYSYDSFNSCDFLENASIICICVCICTNYTVAISSSTIQIFKIIALEPFKCSIYW